MRAAPDISYGRLRGELAGQRVRESARFRIPELELQARVFGGEFGVSWRGEEGEEVRVIHFGTWNREPGPDFCSAQVLINGVKFTGDIEIDHDVKDWQNHGHFRNAAYENVILHLFVRKGRQRCFTSTRQNKAVTQVCLALETAPKASEPARDAGIDEQRAAKLIEAAAAFRLRRKCEIFRRATSLRGGDQALFEAIAAAMGFKNNKIPFLLVAQRTSLARARAPDGEALLFGLSGFLKAGHFDEGGGEARTYLRELWAKWWLLRDREQRLILPDEAWKLSALRPSNHPHRRMGALAAIARAFGPIDRAIKTGHDDDFAERFRALQHPFWERHSSLGGEPLRKTTSLIGADRIRDLLINVFLPARGYDQAWPKLCTLPGPTPSRKVLSASEWLVGAAVPALVRSAMHQQGLLQLAEDFRHMTSREVWESFAHGWTAPEIVRNINP